jgi:hypothetical protein
MNQKSLTKCCRSGKLGAHYLREEVRGTREAGLDRTASRGCGLPGRPCWLIRGSNLQFIPSRIPNGVCFNRWWHSRTPFELNGPAVLLPRRAKLTTMRRRVITGGLDPPYPLGTIASAKSPTLRLIRARFRLRARAFARHLEGANAFP